MTFRVAVDIGGTFTDLAAVDGDTGGLREAKVLTRPQHPDHGVLDAIDRSGIPPDQTSHFLHGTTLVINALTERKGARTALIATAGFGDVLEIQRCNRRDMYNVRYEKPRPIVPRSRVWEVRERISSAGDVLVQLHEEDIRVIAQACRESQIQAVAVCLLNAYANPEHEVRCHALLEAALPGVPITVSHLLTREWREYERASTAVLNSYVQPAMAGYLGALESALEARGVTGPKHVMQSNGRVTTFRGAALRPITLIESGPVAGVLGAAVIGRAVGVSDLISLDIGGTTAKASLIRAGHPALHTEYYIERDRWHSGYPVKVPTVDILEVGAGGGSIARLDSTGRLLVGPHSAGADPGPASYACGGTDPTVTDAFLLTGVLDPRYFLGGALVLDVEAAHQAYMRLARQIGATIEQTALGVIRLANANMANALRLVSVHRGHDPRDLALLAMGGGGPMHAGTLARELGIRTVIVPPRSGVFSAFGMLHSDLGIDLIRTRLLRLERPGVLDHVDATFAEMQREALQVLEASLVRCAQPYFLRALDMRYKGQEHTVEVPLPAQVDLHALEDRFHEAHERRYTFRLSDPIEIVNFRLAAGVALAKPAPPEVPTAHGQLRAVGARTVSFPGGRLETPIYRRDHLQAGMVLKGPAIVEEATTTTVLLAGDMLGVHSTGSLLIEIGGAA